MRRGVQQDALSDKLRRAGAEGKWKQNIERDSMRALSNGMLDLVRCRMH